MAEKLNISGLSVTLDDCLAKIDRLGVSLADLSRHGELLNEIDSVLDDIRQKKEVLVGSGASGSLKQQLAAQLDGLAKAFQSGQGMGEFFRTINRAKDLSPGGGAGLPTFSLPTRTRYEDISRSAVAAGISAPNINGGLLQNVRQALVQVGSGSSLQYGGMNAYMSSRAVGLGDALMGGASPAVRVQSKSLSEHLVEEVRSDSIEESVAIIRHTSDEILDALGGREHRVAGKVSKGKKQAPVVIPSKKSGFSWGSLLKTLGTVGAIGGVAFGALSMPSVQAWINKMMDPKERQKWLDEVQTWFGKKWDDALKVWNTTKEIAEKVWGALGSLVNYIDGVTPQDIGRLGDSMHQRVYSALSPEAQGSVQARVSSELGQAPIEVEGVSGDSWGRMKELAAGGLAVAGLAKWGMRRITKAALKGLYSGAKHIIFGSGGATTSAAGGASAGAALTGVAAVTAILGSVAGAVRSAVLRRKLNAMSAQAALELGQPGFVGYVDGGGDTVTWIPFFRLSDGSGSMLGAGLTSEQQEGLIASQIGTEVGLVNEHNNRMVVEKSVEGIRLALKNTPHPLTMANISQEERHVRLASYNSYRDLIAEGEAVLKDGSPEVVAGYLSKLNALGLIASEDAFSYTVTNGEQLPNLLTRNGSTGESAGDGSFVFLMGAPVENAYIDPQAIMQNGRPTSGKMFIETTKLLNLHQQLGMANGLSVFPLIDGAASWFGVSPNTQGGFVRWVSPSISSPTDFDYYNSLASRPQWHPFNPFKSFTYQNDDEDSTGTSDLQKPISASLDASTTKLVAAEVVALLKKEGIFTNAGSTAVVANNSSTSVEMKVFKNQQGEM